MQIVASQKIVYQINDNEFETVIENQVFDENDTLAKLKEWAHREIYAYYRSPAIQITILPNRNESI